MVFIKIERVKSTLLVCSRRVGSSLTIHTHTRQQIIYHEHKKNRKDRLVKFHIRSGGRDTKKIRIHHLQLHHTRQTRR